jgi:hypothetical protein
MINLLKLIIVNLIGNKENQLTNKPNPGLDRTKSKFRDIRHTLPGALERVSLPTLLEDIKSYVHFRKATKPAIAERNGKDLVIFLHKNNFNPMDSGRFPQI